MFISIDEVRTLLISLTKCSLKELNIADSEKPYLYEVNDTDVDNTHNLLNIWISLYEDVLQIPSTILVDYIKRIGLVTVILEAKELRLQFIQSDFDMSIFVTGTPWAHFRPSFRRCIPIEGILLILGFPTRLFFTGSNLGEAAIRKFKDTNRDFSNHIINEKGDVSWEFKEFRNSDFNPYLVPVSFPVDGWPNPNYRFVSSSKLMIFAIMKRYIREILGDFPMLNSFQLPPSSTYELSRKEATYYNKYVLLSEHRKWVQSFIDLPDDYFIPGINHDKSPRFVGKLITVPKNVGTGRTVLPEEVARQFVGYAYVNGLYESLRKYHYSAYAVGDFENIEGVDAERIHVGNLDVRDQARNQALAKLGSENNLVATMDLSKASDTISVDMCKLLLPEDHYQFLASIRAKRIEYPDGSYSKNNIMFTMGFSATYVIETAIYTAMARTAVDLTWYFADENSRKYFRNINRALAFCFSVGDDVILPSFAADAFRMVCEACGCHVNMDKSYWDSPYRESCGKEFYQGNDITCSYFPRGTSSTRLAELIGLQHKLVDYPLTNAFIIHKCGQYRKNITVNAIGSRYMDIWDVTGPNILTGVVKYQKKTGTLVLTSFGEMDNIKLVSSDMRVSERRYTTITLENVSCTDTDGMYKWHEYLLQVTSRSYSSILQPGTTIKEFVVTPIHSDHKMKIRTVEKKTIFDEESIWRDVTFTNDITGQVDEEPYCQVTIPQVTFKAVNTSVRPWEVERLAYVMSLYEMSRRPKFTNDEYLAFCLDRAYNNPIKNEWQDDYGVILPGELRKSLCATSNTKLVRRIVPVQ